MLTGSDETISTTPDIATPDEVLATFTQLMRGEKTSEQLKAAEQLAKYHSLFTAKEETGCTPELITQIEEAVDQIAAGMRQEAAAKPSARKAASAASATAQPKRTSSRRRRESAPDNTQSTQPADGNGNGPRGT